MLLIWICASTQIQCEFQDRPQTALGYTPYFELGKNWMDGRVVEGGGLENRCGATHRGFESLSIRMC